MFARDSFPVEVRKALVDMKRADVAWEKAWELATKRIRTPDMMWRGWKPTAKDPGTDRLPDRVDRAGVYPIGDGETPLRFLHRHMRLAYLNLPGADMTGLMSADSDEDEHVWPIRTRCSAECEAA